MVARAAPPRTDRRTLIAKALYDCIAEQGYANTTLADIAERAGMSPSHVGYYFDNKAAILEYYASRLYEQVGDRLPSVKEPDPDTLIESIANFRFGERQVSTRFLGVIQEFSGLAVHDDQFHAIKSQHVSAWQKYFEALFERLTPAAGLTAREAGSLAHAVAAGLDTNTLFDPKLKRDEAGRLFALALRMLAAPHAGCTPATDTAEGAKP
ncbi:MAG: TetR/AcrR family transcriptional regulator [Dehalococcoidia bacterium]